MDNEIKVKDYLKERQADKERMKELTIYLKQRIESVDKCYEKLLTDVGGIKIINVTGLSKKEKEEVINKRNCLIVQKHCYEEILGLVEEDKSK